MSVDLINCSCIHEAFDERFSGVKKYARGHLVNQLTSGADGIVDRLMVFSYIFSKQQA
jgi:hypothetical protein